MIIVEIVNPDHIISMFCNSFWSCLNNDCFDAWNLHDVVVLSWMIGAMDQWTRGSLDRTDHTRKEILCSLHIQWSKDLFFLMPMTVIKARKESHGLKYQKITTNDKIFKFLSCIMKLEITVWIMILQIDIAIASSVFDRTAKERREKAQFVESCFRKQNGKRRWKRWNDLRENCWYVCWAHGVRWARCKYLFMHKKKSSM